MFKRSFSKSLTSYSPKYLGSEPYGKRNCQVCQFIVNADTLSPIKVLETSKNIKGPLNYNYVYLLEWRKYKNPYVGKTQT